MKYKQIINFILDTDLYKLTQQQAVIKKFPRAVVKYEFINRRMTDIFPEGFASELRSQVAAFKNIKLTDKEFEYLNTICGTYLDPTYLEFLKGYEFDPSEVGIIQNSKGELSITIEGYWFKTILWEVPLMALISELYFKMTGQEALPFNELKKINNEKSTFFNMSGGLIAADFGTRRRYSYENHNNVIRDFLGNNIQKWLIGSSNVHFAMKYGIKPIGTHAHEWFMFHGTKYGYRLANRMALENWVDVYNGDLGIALTDTFTTDSFFHAFDKQLAMLFDGVRHDSGDAVEFALKVIMHYKKLGIDPKSKTIVFSDGLNIKEVARIQDGIGSQIKYSFGIGTNFTNDVGVKPLNMVIKLTQAKPFNNNFIGTVKLSDNPIKNLGSIEDINLCKRDLNLM
jgi:nicotinate phosphoribosyltransferase